MARKKQGAGKRPVTLSDIAKEAGVSIMAVSHVLNGTAQGRISVGEKKTEKIREAAMRLNYVPNYAAKQLIQGRSGFIGVMIAHDGDRASVHMELLRQLFKKISQTKYHPLTDYTYQDIPRVEQATREFLGRRVDGVIVVVPDFVDKFSGYGTLLDQFEHVVMIGNAPAESKHIITVNHDYAAGVEAAVEHLAECGRRRIAAVPFPLGTYSMQQRFAGYKAGLAKAGIEFDQDLVEGESLKEDEFLPVVQRLVETGADAIIARNDLDALQIVRILEGLGKSIPGDVAVVGYDNGEWTANASPPLTTVELRSEELATIALQMLEAEIDGKPLPQRQLLLTPHLVVRKSS